jgi:hypothetical protein
MSPAADAVDEGDSLYIGIPDKAYVRKTTQSTTLTVVENTQKESKTLEEMIPPQYHAFHSVFKEETSRTLPLFQKWDHAIELLPDTIPSNNCKVLSQFTLSFPLSFSLLFLILLLFPTFPYTHSLTTGLILSFTYMHLPFLHP